MPEEVALAKKANLGCGPLPLYPQDARYMGIKDPFDHKDWLLIDLYIKDPNILNWDIEVLDQIPDGYLEQIYCAHALEHISHQKIHEVLSLWNRKLTQGGTITINVPDLMYAFKQLKALENDQVPDGLYNSYYGLHGVNAIIYGTHSQEGEHHMSGYTASSLAYLLASSGFHDVVVDEIYDDHQMGVLIAKATKGESKEKQSKRIGGLLVDNMKRNLEEKYGK